MNDKYDEQRKFQRIPVQRPRQAKDRAGRAFDQANQATCVRIPKNVVLQARQQLLEEENSKNPFAAVRDFVSGLLR